MSFKDLVKLKLRELEEPLFDPALSGARFYDSSKIQPGYNLCDGRLMDLHAKVIREWPFRYLSLLLPNGSYAAQRKYESREWGLFTWDGKPVWTSSVPIHHDLIPTLQKTFLTATKETQKYKGRAVDFCAVVEFDMQGREIFRWSTWGNLKMLQTFHKPLEIDFPKIPFLPDSAKRKQKTIWGGNYDYYRINSIQLLPETNLGKQDSRFRKGNWLISFRHGSMIFILDQDSKQVVWKCIDRDVKQGLEGQHSVSMLENGRILIFDNGRYRGWSRVIEMNPVDYSIHWQYRSDSFFTLSQGNAQRLSNGNTLITESERGRAFEITREGKTVWEYYLPEIQSPANSEHPESYGRRQWIYRMTRYSPSVIEPLL